MHLSTTMTAQHRPNTDRPLVIPDHQDAPENVKPLRIFLSSQAVAHNFRESAEMDGRGCFRDTEYQDPDQAREKNSVGVDTQDLVLTDMSDLNQLEDKTRAAETVAIKGSSHRNGDHPPASDPLKRTVLPIKMRSVDEMNLETRDRSMQTESVACEQSTQTRKGSAQDIGKSDQFAQTDDSKEVIEIEESIVAVDDSLIMKTGDSSMGDESVLILETPVSELEHQTQEARKGISKSSEEHVHMDQVSKDIDHAGRHPSDVAPLRKLHTSKAESDRFVSFQWAVSSKSLTDSEASVSVSIKTASGPDSDADTFVSLASPAAEKSKQNTRQKSLSTVPNPTTAKRVLDEQSVFSPSSVDPEDSFHASFASLASQAAEKSKQNTLQKSLSTFPNPTYTAKKVLDEQSVFSPSSVDPEDSFHAKSSNQCSSTPNHVHAVSYRSNSSRGLSDTTSSQSVSTSDQSSLSPACNFVGPTYWEGCLSDCETQGKRYFDFDMTESSDDEVTADSETLPSYKLAQKEKRSPLTEQIESMFSKQARKSLSQKEKGSIPELKVLCKSFLGLDVSDSLPLIHLDTEDDIPEMSPRETDSSKDRSTTDDKLQGLQTYMEHDCLMECKRTDDPLARILPEMEMVRSDVNSADAEGQQYEDLALSEQVSQQETDDTSFINESEIFDSEQASQQETDDTFLINQSEILDSDQHAQKEGVLVEDIGTNTAGKSQVSGQHFGESGNKLARGCQTYSAEPTYKTTGTDVVPVDKFVDGAFQQAKLKVAMQGSDSCKTKSSGSSSFDPLPNDFETFCTDEGEGQEYIPDSKEDCTFQLRPTSYGSATYAAKERIFVAQSPDTSSADMNRELDESGQSLHPPDYKLLFDSLGGIPDSPLATHPMQPGAIEHDVSLLFEMEHFSPELACRFSPPIPGPVRGKRNKRIQRVSFSDDVMSGQTVRSPVSPGLTENFDGHTDDAPSGQITSPGAVKIRGATGGEGHGKDKGRSRGEDRQGHGEGEKGETDTGGNENFEGHSDEEPSGQITSPGAVKKRGATGGGHGKDKGRSRGEDRKGHCEGKREGERGTGGDEKENRDRGEGEQRGRDRREDGDGRGLEDGEGEDDPADDIDVTRVRSYVVHVIRMAQLQYKSLSETSKKQPFAEGGDDTEVEFEDTEVFEHTPEDKETDSQNALGPIGQGPDRKLSDPASDKLGELDSRNQSQDPKPMAKHYDTDAGEQNSPVTPREQSQNQDLDGTATEHKYDDTDNVRHNISDEFETPEKTRFSHNLEMSFGNLSMSSMDSSVLQGSGRKKDSASDQDLFLTFEQLQLPPLREGGKITGHSPLEIVSAEPEECPVASPGMDLEQESTLPIFNLELMTVSPPNFHTLETLSSYGDKELLRETQRQGQKERKTSDNAVSSKIQKDESGTAQLPVTMKPSCGEGASPLPPPVDVNTSISLMRTPVRNSGHDIPLEMPKTPVPCVRYRHSMIETSALSDFGTRPNFLKSYSTTDAMPKTGRSRPPLLTARSVTSLYSPLKDMTSDRVKSSPLFDAPRRKSTTALQGASAIRRLDLTSDDPGGIKQTHRPMYAKGKDVGSKRKGGVLESTVIPPQEVVYTKSLSLPQAIQEGEKSHHSLRNSLSTNQTSVSDIAEEENDGFDLEEDSYDSFTQFKAKYGLLLRASKGVSADVAKRPARKTLDFSIEPEAELISTLSEEMSHFAHSFLPEHTAEEMNAEGGEHQKFGKHGEETLEQETNVMRGNDKYDQTIGSLKETQQDFKDTKQDFEETKQDFEDTKQDFKETKQDFKDTKQHFKDTKQDFKDTKQDFKDTKQDFKDTKQDFKETKQDFKDTKQDFKDTKQDFKDTKQDFKETKQDFKDTKQDFKETKQDFKETKRSFFKMSSTSFFIFNAAEHLNKLIKSKLTSSKQNTTPKTPVALPKIPSLPNNTPCTPRTPSETSTPLTPSDSPRIPLTSSETTSTPLTPSKQNSTPMTPVALQNIPSPPNNTPCTALTHIEPISTPLTLSKQNTTPMTPVALQYIPSPPNNTPCTARTPSETSTQLTPSDSPRTPLTPSETTSTPLTPSKQNTTPMTPVALQNIPSPPNNTPCTPRTPSETTSTPLTPSYSSRTPLTPSDSPNTPGYSHAGPQASNYPRSISLTPSSTSSISFTSRTPHITPLSPSNKSAASAQPAIENAGMIKDDKSSMQTEKSSRGCMSPNIFRSALTVDELRCSSEEAPGKVSAGERRIRQTYATRLDQEQCMTEDPKRTPLKEFLARETSERRRKFGMLVASFEEASAGSSPPLSPRIIPPWKRSQEKSETDCKSSAIGVKRGASKETRCRRETPSTPKPKHGAIEESSITACQLEVSKEPSPTTEKCTTLCPEWKPTQQVVGDSSVAFIKHGASTQPSPTTEKSSTLCPEWKPLQKVVGDSSVTFITDRASTQPSPATENSSSLCPEWKPLQQVVGYSSVAFNKHGASTKTSEKSSTLCREWQPKQKVVGDSSVAFINEASTQPSPTTENSSTLCPEWQPLRRGAASEIKQSFEPSRRVSVAKKSSRKLTPYSPGAQDLLSSAAMQSVLVPLASLKGKSATARPLYIVHPITGMVEILKELASGLDVRCFGIQKTDHAVDFSIETLARFYCQAITQQNNTGTYRLAGYSYGGMVVFQMARQMQREGKQVELLLMLDGSPDYVKCQTQFPRRHLPPDASPEHVTAVVETHFLLYIMNMYGPVDQRELVKTMLEEQETQEQRVEAAIGVTMGTVKVNASAARGLWLGLKFKMDQDKKDGGRKVKITVSHVADDIISLKRQQKAMKFLRAADIADKYDASEGEMFQGNIHLVRIKTTPEYSCQLAADYGLGRLCSGIVWIHHVVGGHESMMTSPHVQSVIFAVKEILRDSN